MKSILARKIGMTQHISFETGDMTPVTILEAPANTVLQVKTQSKDGYTAVVLASFPRKTSSKNVAAQYHYVKEVPFTEGDVVKKGDSISVGDFKDVKKVKLIGITKGKGFAGVMKRYGFHGGPATHGSTFHREPGSSGTCAKPGRIQRGKKFPGHMGTKQMSFRDVEILDIDAKKNLIAVKGSIPGSRNSFITLLA